MLYINEYKGQFLCFVCVEFFHALFAFQEIVILKSERDSDINVSWSYDRIWTIDDSVF